MTTEDLRTPSEWEQELGIKVLDADGWDDKNSWSNPITREEFQSRAALSTVSFDPSNPWLGEGPGPVPEELPSWYELRERTKDNSDDS